MQPANFKFGGGPSETIMGLGAAVALLVAIVLVLLLPRKYVIVPVLLGVFLVPEGMVVVLGGVHFTPTRIVALFGCLRLAWVKLSSPDGLFAGRLNSVDNAFALWGIFHASAVILLWRTSEALINQAGFLWSTFGMYFLLRFLIQDEEDIRRVVKLFAIIAAINALGMVYEHYTAKNLFELLIGGVRSIPEVRDGTIRSQGLFQHPILAGTFGATLIALFLWLWKSGKSRIAALTGLVSSATMVLASASSTPVMASGATFLAVCLWPFRKRMRIIRWGIVFSLIALHLVMKAPVWWIIDRVKFVGGSGYHRALLVDQFVTRFGDWWLLGVKDKGDWGFDMWDTSNQFVAEGETGGLLTFIFFITMISRAFGKIGTARKRMEGDGRQEWMLWLLGAAMFAHVVAFFGVSYWDQMKVAWLALLAIISAASAQAITQPLQEPEAELAGVTAAWHVGKSREA